MKNWNKTEYKELQNRLFEEAEEGYRDFVLNGLITERPVLGVRIPKCKVIAKEILAGCVNEGVVREEMIFNFLKNEPVAFEEVAVRGYVIAGLPYERMKREMYPFIELIDNWEICDTFCAEMKKNIRKNQTDFLNEIDKMLKSLDEFQTRVALVCLLDNYVSADYLNVIFDRIADIAKYLSDGEGEMSVVRKKGETGGERIGTVLSWDAYYVKMAIAWLISVCFAKFPDETLLFFEDLKLPRWTYNKAISKTCESYRVDKSLKEELRRLRR